ncbi:MAG TPA: hypothetical protein VKT77_08085, partial [Chthonomonadaceae bacterium]|nr:hypothetical protein [Chthonomonadaceae bacterium]
ALAKAVVALDKRFWNGSFFAERTTNGVDISSIRQIVGVSYLDILAGGASMGSGIDGLLPESRINRALESIWHLNGSPAIAPLAPAGRVGASGAAPGTPVWADPAGALLGDATLAILARRPDAAVPLLRQLDDALDNAVQMPWQSPAAFDARTGAPDRAGGEALGHCASWTALAPLEGFAADLTTGDVVLSPQIPGNWRSIAAPIFSPTFWGRMEFRPTARGGVTSLRIDRLIALPAAVQGGRLSRASALLVTRIRVPGPPPRPAGAAPVEAPVAHVSRGTTPLGVRSARDPNGDFVLTFDTPAILTAGDRLEIDIH